MNLFDLISQSQNGQGIDNLARQFGLDRDQAESAVRHLTPALNAGLRRNTNDGAGLAGLLGALTGGNHERYYDDPDALGSEDAVNEGNGVLGHLFGSKQVSRKVADHASAQTGIGSSILKKMLPVIATMVMGAMAKKMMGGGSSRKLADSVVNKASRRSGSLLGKLAGKAISSGILLTILKKLVFGGGKRQRSGIFGSLLDRDGDGSYVDDLIRMATKGLLK